MPRLSVILPARNAADTVEQAVSSTLRALPLDAELLVLDDGSTDNTAERALSAGTRKGVVDKRLRVEKHEASGGIAAALNWLLHNTDSDIVARMDADDLCLPRRFQPAIRALEHGDDFIFSQVIKFTGWKFQPATPVPITPRAFPVHLLLTNPVSHPAMVAQRTALDSLGGYREVPAEDYDLWIRAAVNGARLRRIAHWGLLYRVHPQQITASQQWRHKSWCDPEQAAVFAQLSENVTGVALERLVATALQPQEEKDAQLRQFHHAVSLAINEIPGTQRLFLKNKLQARVAWAEKYTPETTHPD